MVSVSKLEMRSAWENRYEKPGFDALRGSFARQPGGLLDDARARVLGLEGVEESIDWMGLPWRWTLIYGVEGDSTRALAFLVPDPENLTLATPLSHEMIESMPVRRLKKHVRDGMSGRRNVGRVCWASWSLTSKSQLDEVFDVVKRKHAFIASGRSA